MEETIGLRYELKIVAFERKSRRNTMKDFLYMSCVKIICMPLFLACIVACNVKSPNPEVEQIMRDTSYVGNDTLVSVAGYKNGIISYKLRFINGLATGISEQYDDQGRLMHSKNFFNDEAFGDYIKYSSGSVVREYRFQIDSVNNTFYRKYDTLSKKIEEEQGTPLVKIGMGRKDEVISYKLFFPLTIWRTFKVEFSEDGSDYYTLRLYQQKKMTAQYGYLDKLVGDDTIEKVFLKIYTTDLYDNEKVYEEWVDVSCKTNNQ